MTQYLNRPSLRSMCSIITLVTITTALTTLAGCNNVSPSTPDAQIKPAIKVQTEITPAVKKAIGDYASEGYEKRQQGYDWVGVTIQPYGATDIEIKIRGRADIKQPSCSYDGKATLMGQDNAHGVIFQTIANDSTTFFQFKDGLLTIDSEDKYALNYFCSGGATLVGDYQKLTGNLRLS